MDYKGIYRLANEHPDKTAVVYNGNVISYIAFAQAISGTISHLETQNLTAGRTVAVRIDFLVDCWVVVLALQSLGLNTVCLSPGATLENLELDDIEGLVTTQLDASITPVESENQTGERIVIAPGPSYGGDTLPRSPATLTVSGSGGHILYTSGTTGSYKKAFLDASLQEERNDERIAAYNHCQADTNYHCNGFGLWTGVGYKKPLYVWQMGGTVTLEQRPQWYKYFMESGATNAILIPDQVNELLAYLSDNPSIQPLKNFYLLVAGGFISSQSAELLLNRVSAYLENIYGSTEINVPVLRSLVDNPDDLYWMRPSGYRTVEIVDEQDNVCPQDVEGQLRIRCTELDSSEYLDDPQATEKAFGSGYFYPGDMAVQRADGQIRILGRSVDVVNILGQKRATAPLEERIQQRLGVDAVCLFSSLSDDGDIEYLIAIESESAPEEAGTEDVLRQFSQFGRARVVTISRFPRTQTGTSKVDRIALRKQLFAVR